MNISAQMLRPTLSVVGKGKLLPTKKTVIIPAGLDWEIKTKLNSVLARTAKGIFSTRSQPEDLKNLAQQLGQSINDNPYPVELYGYEIGVLYVFLGEQEQWLDIWWPNAERPLMHRFLRQLKDTLWAVDVYASRPISGIG